jgi:DNA mismatch repair protein MutL
VRVVDDGHGMSGRAAMVAFERHATSKLRELDDLWGISSMGFRGEALPSIASVSRVTLTTRRAGDDAATRIAIEAGRVISVSETGAPVGTTVEVADLLYNVPARLKFLKGDATEASHVTELVAKIAMAYPKLHLRLRHNGRTALDVPPDRDGFARAQALLGPRIAARLVPVTGEESGVRVTAYLGAPELAQTTTRGVQLFVGRRPVRDRGLLHALAMGYGELIPRGRYPVATVLVDVPAGAVDINVHPQKLEVRFSDPAVIAAAVRHVVQAGVASARWREEAGGAGPVQMIASVAPPALPFDGPAATRLAERHVEQMRSRQVPLGFGSPVHIPPVAAPRASGAMAARSATGASAPLSPVTPRDWARHLRDESRAFRAAEPVLDRYQPSGTPSVAAGAAMGELSAAERAPQPVPLTDEPSPLASAPARLAEGTGRTAGHLGSMTRGGTLAGLAGGAAPAAPAAPAAIDASQVESGDFLDAGAQPQAASRFFSALRYLGQLDLTYLICEGDGELVLVDQHAAHERVELARLRARHDSGQGDARVAVQNMLFPVTLDATPPQLELVGRLGGLLAQVGFEVEPFGKATLAVKAVPAGIRHGDPAQLLRSLLREWAESGAPSEAERLDALLGEIACHSVVRAGDRLTASEAETLLRSLDGVDLSLPAPHGRAVLLRLPLAEVGRRFGR